MTRDAEVARAPFPPRTAMPTPHALPYTELHPLPTSANGRRYQLHVALPPALAAGKAAPGRRYPVVYLTDPYWDFSLVHAISGSLLFDRFVPECILVGVGYPGEGLDYEAERVVDLTPVPGSFEPAQAPVGGGGGAFLDVLEREVVPRVERTWPAEPGRRVLLGSSLGGLFGLYAAFTRPALFPAVVAVSPAVCWADGWMFGVEERLEGPLAARLFLSGAAEEWPDFLSAIVRFEAVLRARARPGLDHQWRLIDGERHSGTKAEGFTRGLRFAFGPGSPALTP